MGIKGLSWDEVNERVPTSDDRHATHTIGDKLATLVMLANRLRPEDHRAHRLRLDAINDDLRALAAIRQVEARLVEFARECFTAGIYAAAECEYKPGNPEIARLLAEAKAGLRTAALEADQSLQTPQG